jgi:predicted phage terminase large subunit-like protein
MYFTQKLNKQTRIFSNSAGVMSDVAMPEGWERMWPEFYTALSTYRKEPKRGQHDDAPDALTGVYEMHARKLQHRGVKLVNR